MKIARAALFACIVAIGTPAFADDAKAPPAAGPCVHGPSRMIMGGVDPVEQACALAVAGQTIADQARQIVVLTAQLAVAQSDLDEANKQAAATSEKKAEKPAAVSPEHPDKTATPPKP